MLDQVMDAFAGVTGCDRDALAELVSRASSPSAAQEPAEMLDRVAATERLSQAVQAVQVRQLAEINAAYLAGRPEGMPAGRADASREPGLPAVSRVAALELAEVLRVAPTTAQLRVDAAVRAVNDHPALLARVGTGVVSMSGMGRVLEATAVLEPAHRQVVDAALAAEADRRAMTPGELGKAAHRRALQTDAEAAANRVARSRRDRFVRLTDPVDGTAGIYARVRAEDAVSIIRRIDGTARAMRGSGDPRSLDILRADLFVEALTGCAMVRVAASDASQPDASPPGQSEPRGQVTDPSHPPTWRSIDGVEPVFGQVPPPLVPPDDPPPDDPAWDAYLPSPARDPKSVPLTEPGTSPGTEPETPLDRARRLRRIRETADPDPPPEPEAVSWQLRHDVEVQVVISLATLLGLDDRPGMLRGYGAVPAATILDIVDAAEASGATTGLRGLFCDPVDGRLLTMESRARRFEGGLRSFGVWRDQVDRLTGGRLADLDHVRPRRAGGPTSAGNAQGLGQLTNRVVKERPDVRVRTLPVRPRGDGIDRFRRNAPDIEWTLPSGRRHVSPPPPVLGPGSDPHYEPHQAGSVVEGYFSQRLRDAG